MSQILIDIIMVGAVAFSATRQIGKRRASAPTNPLEASPERRPTSSARGESPETVRAPEGASAPASIQAPGSVDVRRYLLSGQHTGASGTSMAEALEMMSGPGICTPGSR